MNTRIFIALLFIIPMGCTTKGPTPQNSKNQLLDCVTLDIEKLSDDGESTKKVWQSLNAHHRNATSRNFIIFQDGTGNTRKNNTNIWQMYKLAVQNSCNQPIIPYYHRGLGTNFGQLLFGKLTGWGMDEAITAGYKFGSCWVSGSYSGIRIQNERQLLEITSNTFRVTRSLCITT